MKQEGIRSAWGAGFTIIEVLVAVAGLAVIASITVIVNGNIKQKVVEEKLSQDVRKINTAIRLYEASGGVMNGIPDPRFVIGKLKSKATDFDAEGIAGLTGTFVHPHLTPVFMTAAERTTNDARAIWDNANKKFVIARDNSIPGAPVKAFILEERETVDKNLSGVFNTMKEERPKHALELAHTSTWIWDDGPEAAAGGPPSPTDVPLNPGLPPGGGGAPAGSTPLDPPLFSIAAGSYPLSSYDKSLTLANPNDAAVSKILYSIVHGSWVEYNGTPIVVSAGTKVTAYSHSTDPANWTNSGFVEQAYGTEPIALQIAFSAPLSANYAELGGLMEPGGPPVTAAGNLVSLVNAADIPTSYQNNSWFKILWTYDGTNPLDNGDHDLNGQTLPAGTVFEGDPFTGGFPGQAIDISIPKWVGQPSISIQVAAKSMNFDVFNDSAVEPKTITLNPISLRAPQITVNESDVTINKVTAFSDMPVGARVYYTVDGTYPGEVDGDPETGTLYTGPFSLNDHPKPHCGNYTIIAKLYSPVGAKQWFNSSPSASLLVEVPPDPGTPERFAYNYSQSGVATYAVLALDKLETKNNATVYGNVGVGPKGERKLEKLGIAGSYDVDPNSKLNKENATLIPAGTPITPNVVDLSQAVADAKSLSAEALALTPTQTFNKIEKSTTIFSTAASGVNVILLKELKLKGEKTLTLQGGPNDWYIINITKTLEIDDGSIIAPGGVPASHIIINVDGVVADIKGDGIITGTIVAPNSTLAVKDDVTIEGSIIMGKDAKIEKDAVINGAANSFAYECTEEGEAIGGATTLLPPDFSIQGGTYPMNDFDLEVELIDPNLPGAAKIHYALNGGAFMPYPGGPITTVPGTTIEAYAESTDLGRWNDSGTASNTYNGGVTLLLAPEVATSAPKFDAGPNLNVTVTITDPNPPAMGNLIYRVIGGSWAPYTGPFVLNALSYTTDDAHIEAQVISIVPGMADSEVGDGLILKVAPAPLDKPIVEMRPEIGPDRTNVKIDDPNPAGTSEIYFAIFPLPSVQGCSIVRGGDAPPGLFSLYTGSFDVLFSDYPDGFAVIAYAGSINPVYTDSLKTVAYDENDLIGLRGGHFDVDTTGSAKYAGVWSSWPGGGSSDKHSHEYDNKNDLSYVDMFNMQDGHPNVRDIVANDVPFKVVVVNANLSPLAHLVINQRPTLSAPYVDDYDDTAFAALPAYSINGMPGTIRLSNLSVTFDQDAIVNAGLLPSNTGDVKGNTPGKAGEWRNGALTIQLVRVNPDGTPILPLDASKSNGDHGVAPPATALHEMTIFWHWPGASYHDSSNTYVPGVQTTIVSELTDDEEPICGGDVDKKMGGQKLKKPKGKK